jgi:hypothetical protein
MTNSEIKTGHFTHKGGFTAVWRVFIGLVWKATKYRHNINKQLTWTDQLASPTTQKRMGIYVYHTTDA